MRHVAVVASTLLGLLLASTASHAADSYAFGNRVLVVGEGVGKLVELAGTPAHKEPIENEEGARIGERWEYRLDGKTLLVTLEDGKVQRFEEIH